MLSDSLALVATSENSLFTRSLPEWKISSASVKIPSKKENPLHVSTNWPIMSYFICGRQLPVGTLSTAALMELCSDMQEAFRYENVYLFDVVVVKFDLFRESHFAGGT